MTLTTKVIKMSKGNQATGGDARPLPNNFSAKASFGRKNAPKISGAESSGNATGPKLTQNRGKQGRG